jgi:glycine cleavage system H lipoate-binding protein
MTDGGQYLAANGYTDLISLEKQANLAALVNTAGNEATGRSLASWPWLTILALVIVGIIFIIIAVTGNLPSLRSVKAEEVITITPVLNENTVLGPKGLYYDKTHTWAFMEKDGIIRLGVDDFLQHITGAITRVMMKEPGEFVRRGEKILTLIKDGKQLNLYAPISGTIKAQNRDLYKDSSIINTSPYTEGWVYLVEPKNWLREIQFMFMGEKYREWLREEFIRLRNFFEASVISNSAVYNHVVLQDGGELKDNVLADLGPEVWEEFQSRFIDPSK